MNNKFEIDFYEFSFFVEACLPTRPIARTMFFHSVIDKFYHQLDDEHRTKLFNWVKRSPNYDLSNDDTLMFHDRYNPDNQYSIVILFDNKVEQYEAFLHDGKYRTSMNSYIAKEFITEIIKL